MTPRFAALLSIVAAAALMLFARPASASGWACWSKAAEAYNVPIDLMYAIARVESRMHARTVSRPNANGSYDIGLMQINSSWLPTLKKYGITEQALLNDACLNLHVGAWVLSQGIAKFGYNWRGLGAYNASTDSKRAAYARKVVDELREIREERLGDAR